MQANPFDVRKEGWKKVLVLERGAGVINLRRD
jgi:hypothetical protein